MGQLWITGIGIVSAIGIGQAATRQSLLESRCGIGPIKYLLTEHKEFPCGEVPLSNDEMVSRLGIDPSTPMTRTALMGMIALGEALDQAQLSSQDLATVGLVSGTTVGGMDKSEQYYLDFLEGEQHLEFIKTHDCGACTEMIADHYGRFASVTTLSTACSSAANAIIYGAELLAAGQNEVVVAGGSECITKFHLNGFNALRILDEQNCRPFDESRAGLNLGEGAAFLVIETEEHARRRNVQPLAVLAGYGNACDAFHQTASSPDGEGAYRAMSQALQRGGIRPEQVGYINAHGTGTPNNDISESQAMRRIFGDAMPPVSSTKAMTGHTTSASGSIESAICILAMQGNFIPANLGWSNAGECVDPVKELMRDVRLDYVLCNSFGFGGNDSSLLWARPECKVNTVAPGRDEEVYVYAAQQLSIQQPLCDEWMTAPVDHAESYNRAIEPEYKKYIPPMEARRMGKLLKRALVTSKEALAQSGIAMPDAIITGTGLGCIENTELFLDALCREGEQLLKPTHFMQSTHNTISSLMAIQLGCHGYNATYAHKNISFDSALHDALMQLDHGKIHTAMVGGFDEMTPSYFQLLQKAGYLGLEGEISGESSASLIIGHRQEGLSPLCRIAAMRMLYCPTPIELQSQIDDLLAQANIKLCDLSAVLVGRNGAAQSNQAYDTICAQHFAGIPVMQYKHLFGESYTASGIAMYVAAQCLAKQNVPQHLMVDACHTVAEPKHIMVLNLDDNKNYTLTLLSR